MLSDPVYMSFSPERRGTPRPLKKENLFNISKLIGAKINNGLSTKGRDDEDRPNPYELRKHYRFPTALFQL